MGDMARETNMEEILSSIRRVIARDEPPGQAAADGQETAAEQVLELTESHEAASPDDAPQSAPTVTDINSVMADAAALTPQASTDAPTDAEPPLVSGPVVDASRDRLSALTALVAKPQEASSTASSPHALTVDALVRDALRPLLKEWLDTNLPDIVEAMVAKEIARITGRSF